MQETINDDKNYWMEINKELSNITNSLNGLVLISHNSMDFTEIVNFLNKIKKNHFNKILYISLVRSYQYMKKVIEQKPLKNKKINFIDCVSGFAFPQEEHIDNCMYHKPPSNLQQMKDIIKFGFEKTKPDIVILDSLSQFVNFSKITKPELHTLYDFLKTMKEDTIDKSKGTFLLFYDNKLSLMDKLPKQHFDKIIKIELLEDKLKETPKSNIFKID